MAKDDLQEFQSTEKIQGSVGIPGIMSTASALALQPTALGRLGSSIAGAASTRLAEMKGYEMGKDPRGELTPAFTDAGKTLTNAYNASAQAAIGLKLHEHMQNSQLEIANAGMLTPELLNSYKQQSQDAFDEMIKFAPNAAKPGLTAQFNTELLNSSYQMSLKYQKQEKDDQRDKAEIYNRTQTQLLFDQTQMGSQTIQNKDGYNTVLAPGKDLAEQTLAQIKESNNANYAAGIISEKVRDANIHAGELISIAGDITGKAVDARANGTLEEYLKGFNNPENKPESISTSDWQSVQSIMYKRLTGIELNEKANNAALESEFKLSLAQYGDVSPGLMARLDELQEPEKNKLLTHYYTAKNADAKKNRGWQNAYVDFNNRDKFYTHTKANRELAFEHSVQEAKLNNPKNLDEWQIRTNLAANAGGAISTYLRQIEARITSGDPQMIEQGNAAINKINKVQPMNLIGLNEKARANLYNYRTLSIGQDPNVAAQQAREHVYQQDDTFKEAMSKNFREIEKKEFKTPDKKTKYVMKQLGFSGWIASTRSLVMNQGELQTQFFEKFKTNYDLSGGIKDAALKNTVDQMKEVWGDTSINGVPQIMANAPAKLIGVPEMPGNMIIRADNVSQLQARLDQAGLSEKTSKLPYYFSLQGETNIEGLKLLSQRRTELYEKIKSFGVGDTLSSKKIKEKRAATKELRDLDKSFQDLHVGKPIMITKHVRGGKSKQYELMITPSKNLARGTDGGEPVVGDYHLLMKSSDKSSVASNIVSATGINMSYRPRVNRIKDLVNLIEPELSAMRKKEDELEYFKATHPDTWPSLQPSPFGVYR